MKKGKFFRTLAGLISLLLVFSAVGGVYSKNKPVAVEPESVVDDETVYALLTPEGKVKKTVVVDWLRAEGKGNLLVEDFANEKNVEPLKDTPKPRLLKNYLVFFAKSNGFRDLYYQVETKKDLPLEVKITYELNGKKVSAEDILGKSGKIKVIISFTNKLKKQKEITYTDASGNQIRETTEVYTPLFVVTTANLDSSKFDKIKVQNGWLSAQGSKFSLSWFAFPQNKAEVSFEAEGKNIELPSFVISAMPRLPQEVSLDMANEFKKLYDGLNGLSKLSSAHETILLTASSNIDPGKFGKLTQATGGFGLLSQGLKQSENGLNGLAMLVGAQIQILDSLINSLDTSSLDNIEMLVQGLTQLKSGIDGLKVAVDQLKSALEAESMLASQSLDFNQLALQELQAISQDTTNEARFENMFSLLNSQKSLLQTMVNGGEVQPGKTIPSLAEVVEDLAQVSQSLSLMSAQLELIVNQSTQLESLPKNLSQLKSTLLILKNGGNLQGNNLLGLTAVQENLTLLAGGLSNMKSGVDSAVLKMKALETLPDALLKLKMALELVAKGGTMQGKEIPGLNDTANILGKMAEGIGSGYLKMEKGKVVQDILKEEADSYDTFLGRSKKENYSGRVRFIFKVEAVEKK